MLNNSSYERLVQLDAMHRAGDFMIHGSIGHAALMGLELPPVKKIGGTRDIDVYSGAHSKDEAEQTLVDAGLSTPSPVDAGLCGLLLREGHDYFVSKDGVTVPLMDASILDEYKEYKIQGSGGVKIRSFTPQGMLAIHGLEPVNFRISHLAADVKTWAWFKNNGIRIPTKLSQSIVDFHEAYKDSYPLLRNYALKEASTIYASTVPEIIRRRLRRHTHKFMHKYAGRESPYLD